ncbi:hypothetical protein [Streptomyces xinghaiensis]|uniref:hypothetical protein n=1 Tax=Streptomyces xinghaiensis TaxID=1038928 RepID=UPI000301FDFA|nr:hypothetical protein [Streptomyces xinghaiensis]MZE76754.1 hypothetical protein [Streptomyces sp. SID5475]
MSSTSGRDADHALAYPEPPAHPLWHRHGPKTQPLTAEQQKRNHELLRLAACTRRTTTAGESRSCSPT